jgi:general stress protein YciG
MTTLREHLAKAGRKGGKAKNAKLTPEQRSEAARKAVKARWAKHKKAQSPPTG